MHFAALYRQPSLDPQERMASGTAAV